MKKGTLSDVVVLVPMFFLLVIMALVGTLYVSNFNDVVQNDADAAQDVKDQMSDFNSRIPGNIDSGLLLLYIGAHIAIILLGLLLRSTPLAFPFIFIMLIILVATAGFISNAFDEIAGEPDLETYADLLPKSSWILDNYMLVTLLFGFADILIFFGLGALIDRGGGL